jgi:hypothetical protein
MKASIIYEARTQEANNTLTRPSRRATDSNSAYWRTTQNVQRTMIAHAVATSTTDKTYFENALVLEADWGLGRNPLNMIQMTTTSTTLGTKRSVENMYTDGRNDGTPGVDPGQTPYMGTGNWGAGGGADPNLMTALCYPTPTASTTAGGNNNFDALWPLAESYFNTRYCYANAEFTPQQTMRGKMALYGYLYGMNKLKTQTYSLTITAQNGTILKTPDKLNYNYGDSVIISVSPKSNYLFKSWSGDATGTSNPITVGMYNNKTISADFNSTDEVQTPAENRFVIFPNPAVKYFYVKLNDGAQEVKVIVTDLTGKLIMQKNILQSDNKVDISLLKMGVYIVSVNYQNTNEVCKLVKLNINQNTTL